MSKQNNNFSRLNIIVGNNYSTLYFTDHSNTSKSFFKKLTYDEELKTELKQILDNELAVDYMFISSVAQKGIVELKDLLWKQLNT